MKNNIIFWQIITLALLFSACTTIKQKPGTLSPREELMEKESFRKNLPKAELAPVKPNFPKAKKQTLANGLTIMVVEDHRLPIAELSLIWKNGSALDPIGKAGLQNLSTLMLKEGTTKMTSLELAEAFANLGTEVSVGSGKDISFISTGVLSNKIDDAMKIIADMAQHPRLSQNDFARIRSQQQHSIGADMSSPAYIAQVKFLMTAYGQNHPYGYPSAGTEKTVKNISLADVKNAHRKNFGPNNAALVVVGDINMEQVVKWAKIYFGAWKEITDPLVALAEPLKSSEMKTILVSRPSLPQTYLLIGTAVADQLDPDLASYEVFQDIIAGMPTSRLGMNLRESKGWTYGIGSSLVPLRVKGPLFFSTSVQVPYGADALSEILKEFENMKTNPVSKAELDASKSGLLNSFASRFNTLKQIASDLWQNFVYNRPLNSDEILYDKIAQVTPEKILAVANKALKKENMIAVAVGELEVMEIPLASMDVGKVTIENN